MFCGSWAVWCRIRSFRAPVLVVRLDCVGLRVDRVQVPGSCRVDHVGPVGRIVFRLPVQSFRDPLRIVPGLRAAWIVPGSCYLDPVRLPGSWQRALKKVAENNYFRLQL